MRNAASMPSMRSAFVRRYIYMCVFVLPPATRYQIPKDKDSTTTQQAKTKRQIETNGKAQRQKRQKQGD
jgi:hypothetical protein